ncbi:hypothetical protein D3C71_1927190 [compost metagenome]
MGLSVVELVEVRRAGPLRGIQTLVETGTVGLILQEVLAFRRKICSECFLGIGDRRIALALISFLVVVVGVRTAIHGVRRAVQRRRSWILRWSRLIREQL